MSDRTTGSHDDPRVLFGTELRRRRAALGLSQDRLGEAVHVSGDLIAKVEGATRWPPAGLAQRCDSVLRTGGSLTALVPAVRQAREAGKSRKGQERESSDFAAVCTATWDGMKFQPAGSADLIAEIPGGTVFSGTSIPLRVLPGRSTAEGHVRIRDDGTSDSRLLVAAEITDRSTSYYGMAPARNRRDSGCRYDVPSAYRLDDLTYAVLWSLTNYDDALEQNKRALSTAQEQLPASLMDSELPREQLPDCAPVSQMLLGSEFCARHVMDNLDHLGTAPLFWTREQRGEEGATWLYFRHKLEYLRRTSGQAGASFNSSRVFCVPDEAVAASGRPERILLLLSAALMEAHGITVHVTTASDLTDLPGFATAASGPSIVATWNRAEAVWQVATTTSRTRRREFSDAAGFAESTSVIAGVDPGHRLQQFAYYLGLDWRWLRVRARAVAPIGWRGFVRPRNEHLSVAGLDQACRFIAALPA